MDPWSPRDLTEGLPKAEQLQSPQFLVVHRLAGNLSLNLGYVRSMSGLRSVSAQAKKDLGSEHIWPASLSLYGCSQSLKTQERTIPVGPGSTHGVAEL